jgi:hypothetical protein
MIISLLAGAIPHPEKPLRGQLGLNEGAAKP